ncbi:LamB/YcsF family protein [Nitrogeniibacter mangrovi]|uniref:5-oxoprolinase subunit A n=1 Tax=Nitrogeniibacter mangrovi TaxID=2016596 RepID=A0A6C1B766_9RHOO|nr:5-oxoprolinase subunit PxpA [Nitrogeniibacter mangrovi]QID19602.1 LamB/YcsF family protein [Nitrogeniibacter mangrovi]
MKLNLNADLGESFGAWRMGDDEALLPIVDSANIACGFHAGDPRVMRHTVRAAIAAHTSLGAHPAYPDLHGFGRRPMQMAPHELEAAIIYQLGALAGMARAEGGTLTHVKPHGALNNQACEDAALAACVARAIVAFDRDLILLAPACSALVAAGEAAGLLVASEIFADRAYTTAGALVSRSEPGAVLDNPAVCIDHVRRMLDAGGIVAASGTVLPTPIHSICVHGDSADAVDTARALREALEADGHVLAILPDVV